jgi:very-short-patch-repair endonuclease
MPEPRDLLIRLLDYIKEQTKQVNPAAYRLASAKGFQRQRGDIAGLPGVEFDIKLAGDHIWLRITRLIAEPAPVPPPAHKSLIRFSSDPYGSVPSLDEAVLARQVNQSIQAARVRDVPIDVAEAESRQKAEAAEVFDAYSTQWASWAAEERPRRLTITLYRDLFTLMHQMEAEETSNPQELIWGIGISSWQLRSEKAAVAFEYPLLTQAMELTIDDQSMAIEIRPRATETRVELDVFVACQVPGTIEVERTAIAQLSRRRAKPVTPFEPKSYSDVLKLIAGNLDSEGQYVELSAQNSAVPPAGPHLVVTDGWVLLSRPRTINYLFEDLKRLQEKLESGCAIDEGPLALVTPSSDQPLRSELITFRGLSGRGTTTDASAVEELYFPLPYNDEQVTIVQRLKGAPGVTVQGPPGTGKTHTIANVICHYLASGKRVLVTSRGEAALSVLQEKVPEEVRSLTVALLASDRDGLRQFQGSIESIQHRVSQINPELTQQEIVHLRSSIDRAHAELVRIDTRIDQIAQQQLASIEVDGVKMRAQTLAELVISGREKYGWFDDEITLAPVHEPPLSSEDADRLRAVRRSLGEDLVYADISVPPADSLPSVAAVCELHDALIKRETIEKEVRSGELTPLKSNAPEVFEVARALLTLVEEMIAITGDIEGIGEQWPFELRKKCRNASFASERAALESLFTELDVLIEARARFLKFPITFPSDALDDRKAIDAVARGVEKGKPFGLASFGDGLAKEYLAQVRVQGHAPASHEDWKKVQQWIALHEQVLTFEARWNELHQLLSVPALSGGVTSLRQLELIGLSARKAHNLATHFDFIFGKCIAEVFEATFDLDTHTERAELEKIRKQLTNHLLFVSLSNTAIQFSEFQGKLAGMSGPVSDALRAFIAETLGNEGVTRERVAARYGELLEDLRRIASLASDHAYVYNTANRFEAAGAPKLAARIHTVPVTASGEDTVFPPNWHDAWNWARARTHLDSIEAREELVTLARQRRDVEGSLARFYRELVAKAAWLATKCNATPRVLQALAGYATAVRKIGQGTGPNATRYRRDAREMMADAAGAVPCWIMSHSRISEAMPAEIGAFDLVIVDEASQSDLWALPAILRGKKVLVVGDDKQVSPDAGFIESTRIQELLDRFLVEQPFAAEMTPEKSLYDLSARVFAADHVMLREHFRCVPPVIEYSNRTFYQDQILPLRIPRASERIEPPLVDIYVEDGCRDTQNRNEYEAHAIADEIGAILADEKLAGRTIGVVTLLGAEQAKFIDSIVLQRCDAAELRRRKFLCGDAPAFQGSERNIMFLSMVADRDSCTPLSGSMFDQRFNVAASRARDRMYLVRSVLASDLSDKDLRTSLLSHFDRPIAASAASTTKLIDLCESDFEREVFTELTARGFRVIPQAKTGAYRIDLVVEGAGDIRLAIECDGDEFHPLEKWPHDMHRQRILERAGWVFWRCFASTWKMKKDEVVAELCQQLNKMGIEPLGAFEHTTNIVEKRVWRLPVEPAPPAD